MSRTIPASDRRLSPRRPCSQRTQEPSRSLLPGVWALRILVLLLLAADSSHVACGSQGSVPLLLETEVTLQREDVIIEPDGDYQRVGFRVAGQDRRHENIGEPQLPLVVKWFLLPPGTTVQSIEITPTHRLAIPGRYQPFPILDSGGDGRPPRSRTGPRRSILAPSAVSSWPATIECTG